MVETSRMAAIRRTTVDELRGMGQGLFDQHWAECGYSATLPVDIDWKRYYALEMCGHVLAIGAFDREGLLVGYCVTMLGPHAHCQGLVTAVVDVIYVVPHHRGSGVGARLVKETELAARARGARDITWHAPPGSSLERMMSRTRGSAYRVRETVYERVL